MTYSTSTNSNEDPRKILVERAWDNPFSLTPLSQGDEVWAIQSVMGDLDDGKISVCEKVNGQWVTHEWIKKSVLLSFRLHDCDLVDNPMPGFDKIPGKFSSWDLRDYEKAGIRVVPGALVRYSAWVGRSAVLMPCFINVGARIGHGTMVDMGATIGSCAQIGEKCHISAGVVIGGVLEPVQASPVIIEDGCFIGAQSAIVEGVHVGEGAVIGMGVMLGASTPIVDRRTGNISRGAIPPRSVVIPGILPPSQGEFVHLPCAVIVKVVDEKTRERTGINDLLRLDHE